MNFKQNLSLPGLVGLLEVAISLSLCCPRAGANVYATNVRLNGGTTNVDLSTGGTLTISYLLNEPASLGVTVNILASNTVVRRLAFAAGANGTARGSNAVAWDGRDANGNGLAAGVYGISITTAASGYTNWTQISSDDDAGAYAFDPQGIAVDRNPTSPYYGRVLIANASTSPATNPPIGGDLTGVLKFNADSSAAEEPVSSGGTDGHVWAGNGSSPWKLEVSADDLLYVDDLANGGEVFRWDPLVASNSLVSVLRNDNRPASANLGGLAIVGSGTNTQIWMADNVSGHGILKWSVGADGTCAQNDVGQTVVGVSPSTSLSLGPADVAVDTNGNIYACENVTQTGDTTPRVLQFPAYDPSTNGGVPEYMASWAVGTNDDTYTGASGLAVDPSGQYVAVAFQGMLDQSFFPIYGNTKILSARTGGLIANLDLDVEMNGDTRHQDTDCAWDAVGNVYYVDWWQARWRVVSPPGTNQSTTFALATVTLQGSVELPPPVITSVTVSGGSVLIDFSGTTSDVPGSFQVFGAANVTGPYAVISAAQITQVSPGIFRASILVGGSAQFFRIGRTNVTPPPPQAPYITSLSVVGGVVKIEFTGASGDVPASFEVLGAATVSGPYFIIPAAQITQLSPGLFLATLPASGSAQFFRIGRTSITPPTPQAPHITGLSVAAGVATITFTGSSTDIASAFTLLGAPSLTSTFSGVPGGNITQVSPGVFKATAPASGPMEFYRILR